MKLFKKIVIFLSLFLVFGLTSCDYSQFCSPEDTALIKTTLYQKYEDGRLDANVAYNGISDFTQTAWNEYVTALTGTNDGYSDVEYKVSYSVITSMNVADISQTTVYVDDATTNYYIYSGSAFVSVGTADTDDANSILAVAKAAKISTIYTSFHAKACLSVIDTEDPQTGVDIEGKDWGYAWSKGLIEGLLVYPISAALAFLTNFLGSSGWAAALAIILVTFAVRGLVVALTWKSTVQSQKLQLLQPEMNAINAKYEGLTDENSKNKKAMELMGLYKKYDINPVSSLISPFLTLPIFLAIYGAVRATTVLRASEILGVSLGASLSSGILNWNPICIIIFILMIASQFCSMKVPQWIAKARQKSNYKLKNVNDKSSQSQQNMMLYVMLITVVFAGWMLPVAMSVYWMASSIFSIMQAVLLKDKMNNAKLEVKK